MKRLLLAFIILTFLAPTMKAEAQAAAEAELEKAAEREAEGKKLLYSEGNYIEALVSFELALSAKEHALGHDHIALRTTLMDMALCYRAGGDYVRAEQLYKRALALTEKALGPNHVEVARTLERYACTLRRLGRKGQADNLKARSNKILVQGLVGHGPISGTVVNGARLSMPQPSYPKYLRKQHVAGSVTVNVTIGEDGKVIDACAVDGPPSLAQASERAALQALFTPTTLSGVPVKISGAIRYEFVAK